MRRWILVLSLVLGMTVQGGIVGCLAEGASIHVDARSAVLLEVSTGKVLFEQDADLPIEPASFTKLVTLYLVFEALEKGLARLSDKVWISEEAWRTQGSRMFLEVGSRVPLEEVIKGIAVVSGNDACVAVAEHLTAAWTLSWGP